MNRCDLVGTWTHAFEEGGPGEMVLANAEVRLPRSRRPRIQYEFADDGTATVRDPGPADRREALTGTWMLDGERVVIRLAGQRERVLRFSSMTADRLTLKT